MKEMRRQDRLINESDRNLNKYDAVNRKGEKNLFSLTTISLAAFSNINFAKKINSGELAHYAAELKSKIKKENYSNGTSDFIYEKNTLVQDN
ncbi:MAG: hypothetical protein PF518_13560 [Spirochaetaceae bacterium]|jgi:hypothetical protein|nr:hypothetical protein [Spirochaetaceae bacterium]